MDPYSGLVDMFEKQGLLKQQGNRLKYVDSKGQEMLHYRKDWTGEHLEVIMKDFSDNGDKYNENIETVEETPSESE